MTKANNVTRMLTVKKVNFEIHELPNEKLSAVEAAEYLGVARDEMFKTIVALPSDGGKTILVLVAAEARVEMKALARAMGTIKVKAANQTQAEELTGLQSGGISPLALIDKGFEVILDTSALDIPRIYLSGGQRGLNISLSPSDLIMLTGAKSAAISSI